MADEMRVWVFDPTKDEREVVVISGCDRYVTEPQEATLLARIKAIIGGNIDIGSARPLQFAVGEYSLVDGISQPNMAASRFLGRDIRGVMVMWGVGPGGGSRDVVESWEEAGSD